MKRTSKIIAMLGLTLPALYFGSVSEATAFCVYNHADLDIEVTQIRGGILGDSPDYVPKGSFHKVISPGKEACCNWKNKDCNRKGRRDSFVEFRVERADRVPGAPVSSLCGNNWLGGKAGGWLTISGKDPHLTCRTHFKR